MSPPLNGPNEPRSLPAGDFDRHDFQARILEDREGVDVGYLEPLGRVGERRIDRDEIGKRQLDRERVALAGLRCGGKSTPTFPENTHSIRK